jgi:hypothetical protein
MFDIILFQNIVFIILTATNLAQQMLEYEPNGKGISTALVVLLN